MRFEFHITNHDGIREQVFSRYGDLFLHFAASRPVRDETLRDLTVDAIPDTMQHGCVFLDDLSYEGKAEFADAMDELWTTIEAGTYDFGPWIRQNNTQVRVASDLLKLRRLLRKVTRVS